MEIFQRGGLVAEADLGAENGATFEAQRDEEDIEKETYPQDKTDATNTSKTIASDSESSRTAIPAPPASGPPTEESKENEPESQRSIFQTFIIMLCLCSSVFLAALDTTIITTALPTISEYFQSTAGYTWIGSAYLLTNSASTPSWGKISDIWGRKPILLCAGGVFFLGSALAGGSSSIAMLIGARAVQGVGGGGLIILSNICIADLFAVRNRGKYYGMIGYVNLPPTWILYTISC